MVSAVRLLHSTRALSSPPGSVEQVSPLAEALTSTQVLQSLEEQILSVNSLWPQSRIAHVGRGELGTWVQVSSVTLPLLPLEQPDPVKKVAEEVVHVPARAEAAHAPRKNRARSIYQWEKKPQAKTGTRLESAAVGSEKKTKTFPGSRLPERAAGGSQVLDAAVNASALIQCAHATKHAWRRWRSPTLLASAFLGVRGALFDKVLLRTQPSPSPAARLRTAPSPPLRIHYVSLPVSTNSAIRPTIRNFSTG